MSDQQATIKIGFIGAGRMAQALAKGLANQKQGSARNSSSEDRNTDSRLQSADVFFLDPNDEAATAFSSLHPGGNRCQSSAELAESSSIILLAVKPQVMDEVLNELARSISQRHLVVSVAAGIPISRYAETLGTERIIRVMPNTSLSDRPGNVCNVLPRNGQAVGSIAGSHDPGIRRQG